MRLPSDEAEPPPHCRCHFWMFPLPSWPRIRAFVRESIWSLRRAPTPTSARQPSPFNHTTRMTETDDDTFSRNVSLKGRVSYLFIRAWLAVSYSPSQQVSRVIHRLPSLHGRQTGVRLWRPHICFRFWHPLSQCHWRKLSGSAFRSLADRRRRRSIADL